jgi:hypothetical protein
MGKESKKATKEFEKINRKVVRRPRVLTDAVITKLVKKKNSKTRMNKHAKILLKNILINKGVQFFAQGDVVRQKQNMSTLMKSHIQLPAQIDEVPDVYFRQARVKSSNFKSLV